MDNVGNGVENATRKSRKNKDNQENINEFREFIVSKNKIQGDMKVRSGFDSH